MKRLYNNNPKENIVIKSMQSRFGDIYLFTCTCAKMHGCVYVPMCGWTKECISMFILYKSKRSLGWGEDGGGEDWPMFFPPALFTTGGETWTMDISPHQNKILLNLEKNKKRKENYLVHIQSPDFHTEGPPNPKLLLGASPSKLLVGSSLNAPHLKQLERLAKLCALQFPAEQYQSPGRTTGANPLDPPGLGSLQSWQHSLQLKFMCWHDLQFQSPGLLFIFSDHNIQLERKDGKKTKPIENEREGKKIHILILFLG